MRATALEVTETTALVELRPCWLARMFGARTVVVELVWIEDGHSQTSGQWHSQPTGRCVIEIPYGHAIRNALDFRPAAQLPRAEVRR